MAQKGRITNTVPILVNPLKYEFYITHTSIIKHKRKKCKLYLIPKYIYLQLSNQEIKMPIGENIKKLRVKKAMTQKDLAQKVGIKIAHISRLENDSGDPKLSTLVRLMESLDCTPNDLFINEESSTNSQLFNEIEKINELNESVKIELISIIKKYVMFNEVIQSIRNTIEFMGITNKGEIDTIIDILENADIDINKIIKNKGN